MKEMFSLGTGSDDEKWSMKMEWPLWLDGWGGVLVSRIDAVRVITIYGNCYKNPMKMVGFPDCPLPACFFYSRPEWTS